MGPRSAPCRPPLSGPVREARRSRDECSWVGYVTPFCTGVRVLPAGETQLCGGSRGAPGPARPKTGRCPPRWTLARLCHQLRSRSFQVKSHLWEARPLGPQVAFTGFSSVGSGRARPEPWPAWPPPAWVSVTSGFRSRSLCAWHSAGCVTRTQNTCAEQQVLKPCFILVLSLYDALFLPSSRFPPSRVR